MFGGINAFLILANSFVTLSDFKAIVIVIAFGEVIVFATVGGDTGHILPTFKRTISAGIERLTTFLFATVFVVDGQAGICRLISERIVVVGTAITDVFRDFGSHILVSEEEDQSVEIA